MTATQPLLAYLRTTTQATRRTTRVLTQAIRLLWEASPTHTLLSGVLYAVQGIVPPVKIWLMKVLIDRIAASIQGASLTGWHDWLWPAALLLVSKLVEMWAQSASQAVSELLENQVVLRTQYLIFKKTAELDMAFFENAAFYDRLVNARNEIWRLHNVPFLSLSIVQQILALIFTLSLLMQLQPFAIVILFFTAVPYALLKSYFQTQQFNLAVGRIPAQRMVDYLGYRLLGVREAVKEIRIFGLEPILLQRFVDFWQERIEEQARLSRREVHVTSILALLPAAGVVSVWGYALAQAAVGTITIGTLALAFQAAEQAQAGFRLLFQQTGYLYGHTLYLTELFKLLSLSSASVQGAIEKASLAHPVPDPIKQGIEFRNVSFRYPGSETYVLKSVSFTLRPGETVALVGENGAGKTTAAKLLARLYDPTEGTILLDNRDLRDYDLESYQRQIGIIFQDFVHYHLTARENVSFGYVEAMDDEARILEAVALGGAQSLIHDLPQGLDTTLGKTFEGGVDLSGGQWQKLALSRAFMRAGQLLVLDEPTAALDPLAEYEVYQRFADLVNGKMAILVSHRFSTVKMADRILVLRAGTLIEEGTHEELVALQGRYAEMFSKQAESFQ